MTRRIRLAVVTPIRTARAVYATARDTIRTRLLRAVRTVAYWARWIVRPLSLEWTLTDDYALRCWLERNQGGENA